MVDIGVSCHSVPLIILWPKHRALNDEVSMVPPRARREAGEYQQGLLCQDGLAHGGEAQTRRRALAWTRV